MGASNQPQIYPKLKAALSQPTLMALAWLTSELMAAEQWGETTGLAQIAPVHCSTMRENFHLPELWNGLRPRVCCKDAKAWRMLAVKHYQPNLRPGHGWVENSEGSKRGEKQSRGSSGKGLREEWVPWATLFLIRVPCPGQILPILVDFSDPTCGHPVSNNVSLQIINYVAECIFLKRYQ